MKHVARRRTVAGVLITATAVVAGFLVLPGVAYAGDITAVTPSFSVNDDPAEILTFSTTAAMPRRSKVTITRIGGTAVNGDEQSAFTSDNTPTTSPKATFNFQDGSNSNGTLDGPANPGVYSVKIVQGPFDEFGIINQNPAPATDACSLCFTIFPAAPITLSQLSPSGLAQNSSANVTFTGTGFARGTRVDVLLPNGTPDPKVNPNGVPFDSYPDETDPDHQANCGLDAQTAPCEVEIVDRTTNTKLIRRVEVLPDALTGVRDVRVTNTDGTSALCVGCFTINGSPLQGVTPNVANNDPSATPSVRIEFFGSNLQANSTPRLIFVGTDAGSSTKDALSITGRNATYSSTRVSADFDVRNAAPGTNVYQPVLFAPDGSFNACTCRFSIAQTQPPQVTTVNPSSATQSDSRTVTINGSRFSKGTRVVFSGTGITVTSVEIVSPSQLRANIQVASNAAAGPRDVNATTTDGKSGTPCAKCFTVIATGSPTPSATSTATISPQPSGCPSSGVTVTVNTPTINATGLASVTVTGAAASATVQLQGYSQNHFGTVTFDNDPTPVDRTGKADNNGTVTFNDLRPASNTRLRARQLNCIYNNQSAVIEVRAQETLEVVRTGLRSYTFRGRSIPAREGGLIVSLYRIIGTACGPGVEPSRCPGERFIGQARAVALGSPGEGLYSIRIVFPAADQNKRDEFVVKTGRDAQNAPGRSNARSLLIN